ncbi:MAG TPA: Kdo hydroxylase family protein [Candidatus Sulfopaludibacter sp.]|nr:Kdo hydroxylase family protein [Candidatus Sulfopaludibacter sp.]
MGVMRIEAKTLALPLAAEAAHPYCAALEAGEILHLGASPIAFSAEELEFLRGQKKSEAGYHKNVAYRPRQDRLTGYAGAEAERMHALMRDFSRQALAFLRALLSPSRFDVDYASFRPLEEQGRPAKQNARNDLLHVDSFPTRPSRGRRILRFFVNVNPSEPRIWKTGPAFPALARELAAPSGLLAAYRHQRAQPRWRQALNAGLGRMGMANQFRPPYDRFMLSFHDWLKANGEFQSRQHLISEFEPMASWMCMTDTVSHAVLRGRFALEQTVLVLPETLQAPAEAPANVLAAMAG